MHNTTRMHTTSRRLVLVLATSVVSIQYEHTSYVCIRIVRVFHIEYELVYYIYIIYSTSMHTTLVRGVHVYTLTCIHRLQYVCICIL